VFKDAPQVLYARGRESAKLWGILSIIRTENQAKLRRFAFSFGFPLKVLLCGSRSITSIVCGFHGLLIVMLVSTRRKCRSIAAVCSCIVPKSLSISKRARLTPMAVFRTTSDCSFVRSCSMSISVEPSSTIVWLKWKLLFHRTIPTRVPIIPATCPSALTLC
jgi:hypothetical protein